MRQPARPLPTIEYLRYHVDERHQSLAAICASLGLNLIIATRLLEQGRGAHRAAQHQRKVQDEQQKTQAKRAGSR